MCSSTSLARCGSRVDPDVAGRAGELDRWGVLVGVLASNAGVTPA